MEYVIHNFETLWISSDATKVYVLTSTTYSTQGSYSMIMSGTTSSSGVTISKDFGTGATIDLSDYNEIRFNIKSDITAIFGSSTANTNSTPIFLKFGFSVDNVTYTEYSVPIYQTDYFEQVVFDISEVTRTNKENIRYFKFTVVDQTRAFIVYIDELLAITPELFFDVEEKLKFTLDDITIDNQNIEVGFAERQTKGGYEIKFPSITLRQTDVTSNRIGNLGEDITRNGDDDSVRVYDIPDSWFIKYDIKTWSKSAEHDRKLQEELLKLLPDRGYLIIRGGMCDVSLVGYLNNDDSNGKETIYNKIFTYVIESVGGATYKSTDKLVKSIVRDYKGVDGNDI